MLSRLSQFLQRDSSEPVSAPPIYSLPQGMRVYAVGDIHGRLGLLNAMLAAIAKDDAVLPPAHVVEVFLGDYIDRGMQSREVITELLKPSPLGHTRVCLLGNHEDALLRFLQDPSRLREWGNVGGYATLASYGVPMPRSMTPEHLLELRQKFIDQLPAEHLAFLRKLPLFYPLGGYLFVHAGIRPSVAIEEQSREQLLWIREPFLRHEGYHSHYVVHGHSPVSAPDIRGNRANLDVSAAPTDQLCALVIEGSEHRILGVTA